MFAVAHEPSLATTSTTSTLATTSTAGPAEAVSAERIVDVARSRVAEVLVLVTLAVAPVFLVVSGDPSKWKRGVIFQAVDLLLIALATFRAKAIVRGILAERTGVTTALVAVLAALALSFALHPSTTGAMTLARFAGAIALIAELAHGSPEFRASAAKVWLGWCAVQALVAVGQKALGHGLGVPGEVGEPFEYLNGFAVPTGTSYGPHPIAAMGLVGIGLAVFGLHHGLVSRRWATLGAMGGAVTVGITCGTAGAVSLALLLISAVTTATVRRRRRQPDENRNVVPVLIAVAIAFALAASASIDGWRFKAERSATTDVAAASNGRAGMIDEAVAMIKRWPILGVGPGRFMATRDAHPDIKALATEDQQVHNVPLLIVTESGVVGAIALGALVVTLARRIRRQAFALALCAAMSGHLMFDHAPWTFGFGMVQIALVLGFVGAGQSAARGGLQEPGVTKKSATLATNPLAAS